jgi:hypothetical protein
MSLLDRLDDPAAWADFLADKRAKAHLTPREDAALAAFAAAGGYRDPAARLRRGDWPAPQRREVNKAGSGKKRVVYSFPEPESFTLKLLAWLLYRYDDRQPPGCYSFRRGLGAHTAIRTLVRTPGIGRLWCYKADVKDYFNSIPVAGMVQVLGEVVDDDPELLAALTGLLARDEALEDGVVVPGPRGVMAGIPIAPFLANLYLGGLDRQFAGQRPYARYSDDIIVFAPSEAEIGDCRARIASWLAGCGLAVNPKKETLTAPGEPWEFLGIAYDQGHLDLSAATRTKLKAKIRRKARSLRRWMARRDATAERAMAALIRAYNRKFFSGRGRDELNWSRWFFPLLTRDDTLAEMDAYLQQYLRWLPTGHHRKANFRTSYADLKKLGYRTLVNEYHRYRAHAAGGREDADAAA